MELPKDFSQRIYRYRMEHNFTLEEMAEICGVHTRTVWSWERGKIKRPHDRTIYRIQKAIPSLWKDAA